jgi:hypothetical protein
MVSIWSGGLCGLGSLSEERRPRRREVIPSGERRHTKDICGNLYNSKLVCITSMSPRGCLIQRIEWENGVLQLFAVAYPSIQWKTTLLRAAYFDLLMCSQVTVFTHPGLMSRSRTEPTVQLIEQWRCSEEDDSDNGGAQVSKSQAPSSPRIRFFAGLGTGPLDLKRPALPPGPGRPNGWHWRTGWDDAELALPRCDGRKTRRR